MKKKLCQDCGQEILAATYERTGGYCMPCKKYRDLDMPGQRKNEETQIPSQATVDDTKDPADQIPLSSRTERIASALFSEPERAHISKRLLVEVSKNIPFCNDSTPEQMERSRFAIMKLIAQHPKNENIAFDTAKQDWRDLLMMAGFGYSVTEHEHWFNEVLKQTG